MYHISDFTSDSDVKILDRLGPFTVIECQEDLSVMPPGAATTYFSATMDVRRRQAVCDLSKVDITLQVGAMQWMAGNINVTTGIKGIGNLFGKTVHEKVTGESVIKSEYAGDGTMVLEPTCRHIILLDLADWNGSTVLDDGLLLACDSSLKYKTITCFNLFSAMAGGEGLFSLGINSSGVLCLESPCLKEELVEITLDNDVLKIDGSMAIAWSGSLNFIVERPGKSLIGSTASGEGPANAYRGTGKVLLAPIAK